MKRFKFHCVLFYLFLIGAAQAGLEPLFEQAASRPVPERIAFWAKKLFENPELLASMNHAPAASDVASFIPVHFDCTTYVETVLGLARSNRAQDLFSQILKIRYHDAKPSFESRNHFPEIDWIPNNIAAGILQDSTEEIAKSAGIATKTISKRFERNRWISAEAKKLGIILAHPIDERQTILGSVRYIPITQIEKAFRFIPTGTIVNIVRRQSASEPLLITHQGLLIGTDFYHAKKPRIKQTPFLKYIARIQKDHWTVLGINLNKAR